MEKKLEVKNLQVSFKTSSGNVKAVRDISFDLYKGETLAIVGESGSGKSVTSKAIIGILANNSIVEGGEILYDGQDLLKISEDDFHKIRGDKISMIFQDPMSSLNPIMTVGKQLTEAMILKGKSSQKNAKRSFNEKLAILNEFMDVANENDKEGNKAKCTTFNAFTLSSVKQEYAYNEAKNHIVSALLEVNELLFLMEKKQKVEVFSKLKFIKSEISKSVAPFLLSAEESSKYEEVIDSLIKEKANDEAVMNALKGVRDFLDKTNELKKINYFTLGYLMYSHPEIEVNSLSVDEVDKMSREYLDSEFMINFIASIEDAVLFAQRESIDKKKILVEKLSSLEKCISLEGEKETMGVVSPIIKEVQDAINRLAVYKNSTEYCFASALTHAIESYFKGVKENPKAERKYAREKAKYDALVAKGKVPSWKVIPPLTIDLELAESNISKIISNLKESYIKEIDNFETYSKVDEAIRIIDYLKEQASLYSYKVTKKIAKARALKLLKEVGIPEPEIRYKQYPFQFSGGMRQRIVIAIALSANPDILICDEPTTALDVTIQSQILELINDIKKERNLSVIFITHDLGVVAMMADRIAVMYAGKIVEYGTSEDVFYDPRHPYTWALLSSMPDLDTKETLEAIPGTPPNMIYPPKGDAFADRNKYALEIDFEKQPPLFEVTPTHYAATWLLHPNAPKINPPKIVMDRIERMKEKVFEDE